MRLQDREVEAEPDFAILEDRPSQRRLLHLVWIPIISKTTAKRSLGRHSKLPFASKSTISTTRPRKVHSSSSDCTTYLMALLDKSGSVP